MQLTIIKTNKLSVFTLPEKIYGNYWITDFENGKKINLINVEAKEGKWQLVSNQDAYVVDNDGVMVPYAELKEYSFRLIKNNYKDETYYLYCSPIYDTSYCELGISNDSKITVGSDSKCDITYKLKGVPNKAFVIERKNQKYYLDLLQETAVYVNQRVVKSTRKIEYGDVIFIYGLKIILMRKNGNDYLLVNNPANLLEFNASFVNVVPQDSGFIDDNSELPDDSMYKEVNYFYRAPRFYKVLNKFVLSIDAPPSKKEQDNNPAVLTIGPMITMSMTSVIMLISTMSSVSKGEKDMSQSLTSLIMGGAMLASSLLWPLLTRGYQKISDKLYEKKRQKLYKRYIKRKEKNINDELEIQKSSLIDNNLSVTECQNIIKEHSSKLWQRRISDSDFLTLPVGIGNVPMQIEIQYPEEHFTLSEDNLMDTAYELGKKERLLTDVPITFSFKDNIGTGIVGDSYLTKELADRLLLQIMANYSYDEVKIITFTSDDNEKNWEYLKTLPHSWNNEKTFRYFGASNDDYREIMYVLEKIYNERRQKQKEVTTFNTHYVIITDVIKSIDSYDFIKNIMASKNNYGFSVIMLVDNISALPNECKNFINVGKDECVIFSSVLNNEVQKFKIDLSSIEDIYDCAEELANIPIDIKSNVESKLPDIYHFLEMYQVGRVDQLNVLDRWKKSNPILSLQAPVGIGKNGEIINLDLHEKYHGPHGLIAGTTGSGKSEFIISFILSLAINYNPYEVQMILIDYKGGGLASAFVNDRYSLPHIAGVITNLDGNELNRSLASIESEVKRRQREFNDAKKISNESTMDIYKYQKLYREGRLQGKEPISHLIIISDEFAELKEQQQDFMDKLISVARIGRSLGVHLILATQKPGGIVDQQIWSNTRFRVCLKVQETSDSQEILKKPDAAYLQKRGRFFLQVGTDEVYTLGQSSWSGGQYFPSTTFKKELDTSVNFINNIGFITTTKDNKIVEKVESQGEELPNIVKYISDFASSQNIKIKRLWLDRIPNNIYVDKLKAKYDYKKEDYYLNPVIGEYDDPNNQNQSILTVPFTKHGNALIYGITGSGKEEFLSSLIYSCISTYSQDELNFYILDFGAETLRIFSKAPHVGDIVFVNDEDKMTNLFKLLYNELDKRKSIFAEYGGTYQDYIKRSNKKIQNIVVIINNYEALVENYEDLSDDLAKISRDAYKYGIFFVITATAENSVRLKTRQNFSLVYVLQQNNDYDYSSILGNINGKLPSKNKGRGLFKRNNIYEFQTAFITTENQTDFVLDYCDKVAKESNVKAKRIPTLPNIVDYNYVKDDLSNKNLIIGVNKNTLDFVNYNLNKEVINLISSQEIDNTYNFVNAFIKELQYLEMYEISIVNSTEIIFDKGKLNAKIYVDHFNEFVNGYDEYTNKLYDIYSKDNYNSTRIDNLKKHLIVIYGVSNFINKLNDDAKNKYINIVKKNKELKNVLFVFVDTPDEIKTFSYDEWFKIGTDVTKGIWIGSGVTDQTLIKVGRYSREDSEEIPKDFGYLILNSKLTKIKLLMNFEKNDNSGVK